MNELDVLVEALAQAKVAADAYNQYAHSDENNAIRCHNLRLYLQHMAERKPSLLLVAEAPGYRGCRITGVPVTSRAILSEGIDELGLFGLRRGFKTTADAGFENIYREQSATILWGTLSNYRTVPLIWNTYPFHPHQADNPLSNRTPRRDEIEAGRPFLRDILAIFHFKRVVAVGNIAESALRSLGIDCKKIRHPAQGGKNDFVRGIHDVFSNIPYSTDV